MTLPRECCDFEGCDGEPIGYISRICHGPTFCAEHEDWAWEQFRLWSQQDEEEPFIKWLNRREGI
jgi:hypothetical protein